ncbi:MAG: amidase [Pseudomonadota bacterium]
MTPTDLCYLSASNALKAFKSGTLSPVDLMQALIARAEAVEPRINAFTFQYFEEALEEAKKAEAWYGRGAEHRPLEGLGVAIKDSGLIAGKPTSAGSLTTTEEPAKTTSVVNARILDAGGICHARTATPEFSCAAVTHSLRWGITRNPWNTDFTPGGSSGGAGAALAAGATTLASGSDIGGSIRIPAGCSGVIGYKPPHGINPVDPPFNLDTYCHTGPMARTMDDIVLFQSVLAGDTARYRTLSTTGSLKGMRIAYSRNLGFFEVDQDVEAATLNAVHVLREAGAIVEEIDLQWSEVSLDAAQDHLTAIFAASIHDAIQTSSAEVTPYTRAFVERLKTLDPDAFYRSLLIKAQMIEAFDDVMEDFDLMVAPTNARAAVPAEFEPARDALEINGVKVDSALGWVMTYPFNILSDCPVLSVPSGFAQTGIPTGMQIIGKQRNENAVLRAGLAFEAETGGFLVDGSRPPL